VRAACIAVWAVVAVACTGGTTTKTDGSGDSGTTTTGNTTTGDTTTCDVIEDRSCGHAVHSGDTGCPDGYACWGPSAFVCYRGNCDLPICLPPDAAIDTPDGPRPVSELAPGDPVYTLSADGRVVVAPIARVGSRVAPRDHRVVDLALADGRRVRGSPGHPTADGRRLGDLVPGDLVDGVIVTGADLVPFGADRTWDLRPASATGAYWADGVLLGSTLR
jgi:hypothetical protein